MLVFKENLYTIEEDTIFLNECYGDFADTHIHNFFEFVYTMNGSCTHYIDGKEYKTSVGDLVYISYGQTHKFEASKDVRKINILVKPEFISGDLVNTEDILTLFGHSMFAEFYNTIDTPQQYVHFEGDEHSKINTLINMMLREWYNKDCGYKSVLHGVVRILFSKMLRCMSSDKNKYRSNVVLEDVLDYIDENFSKKISLNDLAERACYNPVYFGSLLKKFCGKNFSQYLKEKRISNAAKLLKNSNKTIDEIMTESGYNDKKLFYAHFREIYNTTPRKYVEL